MNIINKRHLIKVNIENVDTMNIRIPRAHYNTKSQIVNYERTTMSTPIEDTGPNSGFSVTSEKESHRSRSVGRCIFFVCTQESRRTPSVPALSSVTCRTVFLLFLPKRRRRRHDDRPPKRTPATKKKSLRHHRVHRMSRR